MWQSEEENVNDTVCFIIRETLTIILFIIITVWITLSAVVCHKAYVGSEDIWEPVLSFSGGSRDQLRG